MAHLTCQTGSGDSTIYTCGYLLGYTIHYPRSHINHFISTCLTWHSNFRIENTLFLLISCVSWFPQTLLVLIHAIYFKRKSPTLWLSCVVRVCGIIQLFGMNLPKRAMLQMHVTFLWLVVKLHDALKLYFLK